MVGMATDARLFSFLLFDEARCLITSEEEEVQPWCFISSHAAGAAQEWSNLDSSTPRVEFAVCLAKLRIQNPQPVDSSVV